MPGPSIVTREGEQRPVATDQLEQWIVRLERKIDQLITDFHDHAEQPVHAGFMDTLAELRRATQDMRQGFERLNNRWWQIGTAIISILLASLAALLGILWQLLHTLPAAIPPSAIVGH